MEFEGVSFECLGHASVKIVGEKIIYIDPFQLKAPEKADIILITHSHYDHCSIADVKQLIKGDTVIVATPDCQSNFSASRIGTASIKISSPGKKFEIYGIAIEAIPAYNTNKRFHSRNEEWVGYIVTTGGKRFYHAGDTDLIPEMKNLNNIDVAFLPVGGTYTMDAKEAAEAANIIQPKVAVPIHYGVIVGSRADAETFKKLVKGRVELG